MMAYKNFKSSQHHSYYKINDDLCLSTLEYRLYYFGEFGNCIQEGNFKVGVDLRLSQKGYRKREREREDFAAKDAGNFLGIFISIKKKVFFSSIPL